jgi:hypothetical protein
MRILLSDGDTDKLRHRKRCLGDINGENLVFKTFEPRRVQSFEDSEEPVGVYVDGVLASVSADNIEIGEFTLSAAPEDGSVVEATYYYRWFNDAEIQSFLVTASKWLGQGATYANLADGLQPAACHYAASKAYQKLAIKWAEHLSSTFRLADGPDPESRKVQDPYGELAKSFLKQAETLRDDFYKRQGQSLAPLFGRVLGGVRDVPPNR